MAAVIDINNPKSPRIQPLKIINPAEWQGMKAPARDWLVPGICVRGGATLLNGDGGVGKSLLCMQMQTALALGQPWLGINTPAKATRSLGIYCEDEPDELHRRQEDICKYYGCAMSNLDGLALMMSRVGENNSLMSFDRRQGGAITNFFTQVETVINESEIEVVIIDTAADTFGGMEIDREQVRTFVQKLRSWALKSRGAIVITQHPSVSGMASGAGSSGSTGWNNSVRSRIYFTTPSKRDEDGDDIPTNARVLKFMKSNYGPKQPKLQLVWHEGVFKPADEAPPESFVDLVKLRDMLVEAAVEYVKSDTPLGSDRDAKTMLVNRVRSNDSRFKRFNKIKIMEVYNQLLDNKEFVTTTFKNSDSKVRTYVRPSWLRYPSEEGATHAQPL